MAVIHEKRGNKQVAHYFHTLKKSDGSSKRIYLGSDAYAARKSIIALQDARLRNDELSGTADRLKHRLNRIAEHGRPADTRLEEVKKMYYAQKQFDGILKQHRPKRLESLTAVFAAIAAVTMLIALFDSPAITGVSVLDSDIDWTFALTNPFAGAFITIVLIALLGITVIHAKLHVKKKRAEKFQP